MTTNFNQTYVFGDSLSDTGNFLVFTNNQFPTFPYATGRFSNGDNWLDNVTDELNITIDPVFSSSFSLENNLNFAFGGATSGNENVANDETVSTFIGLEQQIDTFEALAAVQNPVLNDDLFFLWVGSNDYFNFIDDDLSTPDIIEADFPNTGAEIKNAVIDVVDINIKGAIQDIIDLGGEDIVVFNLPDLHTTPLARELEPSDRKSLRKLTNTHNRELLQLVKKVEKANPSVNIIHIDTNELFDDILDHPEAFGFTNVKDNYTGIDLYAGTSPTPGTGDPNNYLFWDSVHISSAAQALVADLVTDELTNEGLII